MAEEKRLRKRIEALDGEVKTWDDKAAIAVRAGDDALASEALRRRAEKETERAETQKSLQEQSVYVDQLATALKALEARVKDVKLRQGTLREKARAAKGGAPLSGKTSAFDDFERMSSKIDTVEAEAGLADELSGRTRGVGRRRAQAQGDVREEHAVDDALAALKKKLGAAGRELRLAARHWSIRPTGAGLDASGLSRSRPFCAGAPKLADWPVRGIFFARFTGQIRL